MDEALQKPKSKISLVEGILIGLALVVVSILNLIPFVGDVTSFIAGGLMFFYLYQKGLLGTSTVATNAIGYLCGFIPILQALPTELIAWGITVIIANSPELEAIAEEVGQVEELGEGVAAEESVASEAGASTQAATASTPNQNTTIEMTQTADGTYEYTGTENAEMAAGGESNKSGSATGVQQDETQNRRPSEESTEQPLDNGEEKNSEEEAEDDKKEKLEAEMQTESEKSPEEEAGRKDFDLIQGGRNQRQDQEDDDEDEEGDEDQATDIKKAA